MGGFGTGRRWTQQVVAPGFLALVAFAGGAWLAGGSETPPARRDRVVVADQDADRDEVTPAETARPERDGIVVYGDSLVAQAEPYLASVGDAFASDVEIRAHGGIAPCDALEWLADDVRRSTPDIVVFAFSGNSFSDCMRSSDGRLETGADVVSTYRGDIEGAIRIATRAGVPFLLASPPASVHGPATWQALDQMYREVAAAYQPQVQYVDAGVLIAPEGNYEVTQRCLPFELNLPQSQELCSYGGSIGVRAGDGVHFCTEDADTLVAGPSCDEYSSGALRYAITLVTSARLFLDYLGTLNQGVAGPGG